MLQPLQLQDVTTRYPQEIAELQDFLAKTGLPLNAAETLSNMVTRLQQDRAFRRDLISHVWVVIHLSGRSISYSDLLGVLAVAAAGTHFAASSDDAEAHDLLRFLMQARRSFEAMPETMPNTLPSARMASAARPVARPAELASTTRFAPAREDDPEPVDRRRLAWIAAVACLLMATCAGLWWHSRSGADHNAATSLSARTAADISAPSLPTKIANGHAALGGSPSAANAGPTTQRIWPAKPSPMVPMETAPAAHVSRIIPVHLGTAAVAPAAAARHTTSPSARTKVEPNPLAETATPDAAPESNGGYVASAPRVPYVRPTSLGIMAANVMYSPAPSYPPAAKAAHVQGEVRVEAEVDPDGNVASTRVISGPPLLRDAASDAVQRWHYRPYLYDGKPVAMNALVVMDFHLP